MYSAVQKDDCRLYDLARKGITIDREARPVTIRLGAAFYDRQTACGALRVRCSKRTYIRTLCGTSATPSAAEEPRFPCGTDACGYTLDDCIPLESASAGRSQGGSPRSACGWDFRPSAAVTVSERQAVRFSNGGGLDLGRVTLPGTAGRLALSGSMDRKRAFF